ncbi:MAG: LacI family transcriptional regulator [Spirochaetales bacterium]|nr:LacI family transcriptional regulator [Spirochaetales bacterium]MCF7939521.1 LacI family transcriptional regulator [Spirochaetales bacterium]
MKITLQDVARQAGVSVTTASLVLSGKGKISTEVSKRVLQAAKSTGYQRKNYYKISSTNRSHFISVLYHLSWNYEWLFMHPFFKHLEEVFLQQNYYMVQMEAITPKNSEERFRSIIASRAAAVCSLHFIDTDLFEMLEQVGIPVVIINNSNVQDRYHSVCVDDFQGAYEGARHLIELGHRNIAYLEYQRSDVPTVVTDRYIGFKKAIEEYQLPFPAMWRATVSDVNDIEELREKLSRLFKKENEITAVFAHDDYIAAKMISVLNEIGIRVPQDLSVIAPGDTIAYEEPFSPQITTMSINTALMGNLAADLALHLLNEQVEDIRVLKVKQQMIDRGSCIPCGD